MFPCPGNDEVLWQTDTPQHHQRVLGEVISGYRAEATQDSLDPCMEDCSSSEGLRLSAVLGYLLYFVCYAPIRSRGKSKTVLQDATGSVKAFVRDVILCPSNFQVVPQYS